MDTLLNLTCDYLQTRMLMTKEHRVGRDPDIVGTEGASFVKPCKCGAKLSGQRTLLGRSSGKRLNTDGASRLMAVNLSGPRQRAHALCMCFPFFLGIPIHTPGG